MQPRSLIFETFINVYDVRINVQVEVISLRNFYIQVSRIRNVVYGLERLFLIFHGRFVYLQRHIFEQSIVPGSLL